MQLLLTNICTFIYLLAYITSLKYIIIHKTQIFLSYVNLEKYFTRSL